ncbi:hypothetical protein CQW23_35180 [Capsicum baccatum]|uniref:Uncharacterized protein n=1 Tax=Capsicum baccatum TaxID=33114 RepID=A0A2G2UWV2_CAPBA|nr:hypothetical protein CQW23_35180 [Capsicum baccatum]
MASGATCVQRLDGSRDSAIHTKYRISQCSPSMREPIYPLPRVVFIYRRSTGPPDARRRWGARGRLSIQVFLGAFRAGVPWSPTSACVGDGGGARAECRSTAPARTPQLLNTFARSFCCAGFDNDPFEETESYTPKQPECDLKNQPTAKTPIDEPPMLETQELPNYLRYVFLESRNILPESTNDLSEQHVESIISALKRYKRAMGCTIDDIIVDSPEKRRSHLQKIACPQVSLIVV